MTLKQQVMGGLRWTAGARFSAQLITWTITIIIIRILSPEDYGIMAIASVFISFLAFLNELGLGASIIQREDLNRERLRSLFGLILCVSVVLYAVLSLAAPIIAKFYAEPRLVDLLRIFAFQFVLVGMSVVPQSLLQRRMAFKNIATIDFLSSIIGSVVTLTLAIMDYGVWALVWGALSIRIATLVGLHIAQPSFFLPQFRIKLVWEYFTFGSYVTLSRVLWFFYTNVDVLIIGKILGQELLGFYSVGLHLATLPMNKVSGIINQVAFPAFSSVKSDPGVAGRHFLKAVRVMSFFAFPVLWGVSSIAPEMVGVILGEKWLQATLPLMIISLSIPVRMISNIMTPASFGVGRADIAFFNSLVAFVVMPVAFLVGSYWGLLGVSLAWVIAFPFVFIYNLSRVVKILGISVADVLGAMKLPFLAAFAMLLGVLTVKRVVVLDAKLFEAIVFVVAGAGFYIGATLLWNRRGMHEVIGLLKK